jgi:DNA-binding transcriptional MerR regulator
MNTQSDILSTGDAAKLADVTHPTIYNAELRGELKPVMRTAGGRRLYRREDVVQYIERRNNRNRDMQQLRSTLW